MIGHHFSASAFCNCRAPLGVCRSRGKISSPRSTSRDCSAGSANACTLAALRRSIISFGVRFGAKSAYQLENESDGSPSSAKVGMSGAQRRLCSQPAPTAIEAVFQDIYRSDRRRGPGSAAPRRDRARGQIAFQCTFENSSPGRLAAWQSTSPGCPTCRDSPSLNKHRAECRLRTGHRAPYGPA
jgi:hypothetical protein